MDYSCDVIRDLLLRYLDGTCSDDSKAMIEEHLAECATCSASLESMREQALSTTHAPETSEKRKSGRKTALVVCLCLLALPLLVCFIVNLSVSGTLDWFFIVLHSILVLASLTAVPLVAKKRTFSWSLGAFTLSLLLLLLYCNLSTQGDWFFVAASAILFGLSVICLPIVLQQLPLKGFVLRHRGLWVFISDSVLLYLLIYACGLQAGSAAYWRPALWMTSIVLAFAWVLFLVIRYLRANALVRAGIATLISGLFCAGINDVIEWLVNGVYRIRLLNANLYVWNQAPNINSNVTLLLLLTGIVLGLGLWIAGIIRSANMKKANK